MRMLDLDRKQAVRVLQLYLTTAEANELKRGLEELLKDPEANDHVHVHSDDLSREISFSIVTEKKFNDLDRYTKLEKSILSEK